MLGELANCDKLRFIVTVDHLKASVIFTEHQMDNFNFVCRQIDTFMLDYEYELMYQPELFSAKNDNQEIGLAFIFQSMTKNQRDILKEIATYQLANPQEKGINFRDLL